MNKRLAWVLVFALVVSGSASFLVYRLIASRILAASTPSSTKIMVANRDLPVGTLIRSLDVREMDWNGPLPGRAATDRKAVEDRGVVANIYSGEPILEDRLAAKGAGAGMAATIPAGKRAVAVRVNEVVGLAGFVIPGMRLDVVAMGNNPAGPQNVGSVSKTFLQNIEVLSAGQQIQKDAEGKPVQVQVVNLLVTPEQAEILSLASTEARIQLVLRNPLDKEEVKTKGTAMARLFTDGQPLTEAPKKPRSKAVVAKQEPPPALKMVTEIQQVPVPITVEVIHGMKRAESKFKRDEAPEAAKPSPE